MWTCFRDDEFEKDYDYCLWSPYKYTQVEPPFMKDNVSVTEGAYDLRPGTYETHRDLKCKDLEKRNLEYVVWAVMV